MFPPDMNAAPMGSIIGNGAKVVSKGVTTETYRNAASPAIDIAAAVIARRYRLPPVRARLVCHLAGIGGAA